MTQRIGIPRALLYYNYYPLWKTFFNSLDVGVVSSGKTNKEILDQGAQKVVDEACLPVKIFYGHTIELCKQELDYLFLPRMVSVEKKCYICPKIMGLPDMIRANLTDLPKLITPNLNINVKNPNLEDFIWEAGSVFSQDKRRLKNAWQKAVQAQHEYEIKLLQGIYPAEMYYQQLEPIEKSDITILLLGHDYNIHDEFLNMGIKDKLHKLGCRIISSNQVPKNVIEYELKDSPKYIFWTFGRVLLGTTYNFTNYPGKKGVIFLTSFGCGIDSIVGNMSMRYLAKSQIPYINITLDEHTGEAGLATRVEAFVDLIRWRRAENEDYLSPYGHNLGSFKGHAGTYGTHGSHASLY